MNISKNILLKTIYRYFMKQSLALGLIIFLLASSSAPVFAQLKIAGAGGKSTKSKTTKKINSSKNKKDDRSALKSGTNDDIKGERIISEMPDQKTTIQIMAEEAALAGQKTPSRLWFESGLKKQKVRPDRRNLPDGSGATMPFNRFPYPSKDEEENIFLAPTAPQTLGTQFDGPIGPTETGAFPPDTTGAVGPTQYFVFLNGLLRTYNKTTGIADSVLNVSSDTFFASVKTPPLAGEVVISTDPNIRFDRTSNRWFLNMIDAPLNAGTGAVTRVNRIMIAVSDAASNGIISGTTVWTLYQFTGDATLFTDYQSMGVDSSAMYVGGNMFTIAGAFNSTKGWVIRKSDMLTASPLLVTAFSGLVATSTGAGPFAPRGVDNPQAAATTEGYFIGVDNATFNTLMIRRVTNPGSAAPTISANISIATPLTTRFPVLVPHLGNTGGTGGRLDALDDRLFLATIRNNRLWTAHSIGVNNTGVAGATNNRNAARWYELQNVASPGTPSVFQSGTLFDNNATNDANQRNYWIPSIMVSGQGHAALGCSIAGTSERVNAFTTGRLVGATLGTLSDGPGGAALPGYTASSTAYNPPGDPGGPSRRWGDYSNVSLDPKDDMSMWTIQEYCNATNTYSVRVARLLAPPPPPTNTSTPASIGQGAPSLTLTINGLAPAGQGFYDPGPNPPAPHTTFNHIGATGAGIIVNNINYVSPTQVTINVSTIGSTAGAKTITITNPDGQQTTAQVTVLPTTAAGAEITGKISKSNGTPLRGASLVLQNAQSGENFNTTTKTDGTYLFEDVPTGSTYVMTPAKSGYTFNPPTRTFNLTENLSGADFTAASDAAHSRTIVNDFDGDGISDYAVYRPTEGVWYILQSSTVSMRAEIFGIQSDTPVAADYDGDGKTDVALWRESEGNWYIKQSSDGATVTRTYGQTGDIPVYGFFDEDNKIDLAVFRPNTGTWWIQTSADNANQVVRWGIATDRPVPQDFDGDGKTDIAVFRPENGTWYVIKSASGAYQIQQFGLTGDRPALGDYDGDGRADLSVYRAADAIWYTLESANSAFKAQPYGTSGDRIIAGDYDGDGKSDITVFRPSNSTWYASTLMQGMLTNHWGKTGDTPVTPPSMR